MRTSANASKRTLYDHFHSFPSKKLKSSEDETFRVKSLPRVPGLKLVHDFVSPTEEVEILDFLATQSWRTDLSRRVIHYGGTYCLMPPRNAATEEREMIQNKTLTAEPIPDGLQPFITRMAEYEVYSTYTPPQYCIVNEYVEDQGISAHVENFKFDGPVAGLTLGNGDWIRFHELIAPDDGSVRSGKAARAQRTGRKEDVWMPSRSLLIMTGPAREKWQHEIVRGKRDRCGKDWKRTSLTFRTRTK